MGVPTCPAHALSVIAALGPHRVSIRAPWPFEDGHPELKVKVEEVESVISLATVASR